MANIALTQIAFLLDLADAVLATIQRRLNARPEVAVTLKQVVEDQGTITIGFAENSVLNRMCAALLGDHPGNGLVHRGTADKRPDAALVQKGFLCCPFLIVIVHALTQQVESLLQHRADARITSGFDQFLGEALLFVGQRD